MKWLTEWAFQADTTQIRTCRFPGKRTALWKDGTRSRVNRISWMLFTPIGDHMNKKTITSMLFLATQICSASQVEAESMQLIERIYVDQVPGVSTKSASPVEDFVLFEFSKDGEPLMRAYVGNAPNFPSQSDPHSVTNRTINGLRCEEIEYEQGALFKELLLDLSDHNDWPMFIHFSLPTASRNHSTAIRIVNSVHIRSDE